MKIQQHLTRLEQSGLIRVSQLEPLMEYLFRHALMQDASYHSLLKNDRKRLHGLVADALASTYTDRQMEFAAVIAHHYQRGEVWDRAVEYLTLAGDRAAAIVANANAKLLYEGALEALAHLPQDTQRQRQFVEIVLKLARASAWLPNENVPDLLKQALQTAEQIGEETLQARVMGSIGAYHYVRGQIGESLHWFQRCIPLAEQHGLEDVLLMPYNILGRTMMFALDPRAWGLLQKGIALAEKFNERELLSGSLGMYAALLLASGDIAEAYKLGQRSLDVANDLGVVRLAGSLVLFGGLLSHYIIEDSVDMLTRGVQLCEDHHLAQPLYMGLGQLGYYHAQRGDLERARPFLERSLQLAMSENRFLITPLYQSCYAELLLQSGAAAEALKQAEAAVDLAQKTGQGFYGALAQRSLAKIIVHTDPSRLPEAEQLITQSADKLNQAKFTVWVAIGNLELGRLYANCGQIDKARELIKEAEQQFGTYGMQWYQQQAQKALEDLQ